MFIAVCGVAPEARTIAVDRDIWLRVWYGADDTRLWRAMPRGFPGSAGLKLPSVVQQTVHPEALRVAISMDEIRTKDNVGEPRVPVFKELDEAVLAAPVSVATRGHDLPARASGTVVGV